MFRKIIIPLDGTPLTQQVLPYVQQITIPEQSEIVLVCNLAESSTPSLADVDRSTDTSSEQLYGPIHSYLNQRRDELIQLGYRARVQVAKDGTVTEIIRIATEIGADLIAMTTHGRSQIGRWMLGSVASQVLHNALQPVLLVRAGIALPIQERIRQILVPLDGSALSEQALPVAQMIASEFAVQILLTQVVSSFGGVEGIRPPVTEEAAAFDTIGLISAAETYLQRHQTKLHLGNVTCDWQVLVGEAASSIVTASEAARSDLIVMATHARMGLERYLHGSVAGRVLQRSTCPLLLVKGTVHEEAPQLSGVGGLAPSKG